MFSLAQVHPRFKRDALGVSSKREDPLTRSDFLLDSRQWSSLIVGKISEVRNGTVAVRRFHAWCKEVLYAQDATSDASQCTPPLKSRPIAYYTITTHPIANHIIINHPITTSAIPIHPNTPHTIPWTDVALSGLTWTLLARNPRGRASLPSSRRWRGRLTSPSRRSWPPRLSRGGARTTPGASTRCVYVCVRASLSARVTRALHCTSCLCISSVRCCRICLRWSATQRDACLPLLATTRCCNSGNRASCHWCARSKG